MTRPADDPTAAWFRRAAGELAPHSPLHAGWAERIAADADLLDRIDELPRPHRQPSLLFIAFDLAGMPVDADWPELRSAITADWSAVAATARATTTQTNEVGRCAPLLVALQRIPGPIALLELGASAGLCLAVDRWSYRFTAEHGAESRLGDGPPELRCDVSGDGTLPARMPDIVWRCGIDLAPLDARDPDDRRRLEAMVPPDRPDRRARLRAALDVLRTDPPTLIAGDALAELDRAAAGAPDDAVLVVVSLGTAVYLPPADRAALLDRIRSLSAARAAGAHSVTLESAGALPEVAAAAEGLAAPHPSPFLLAVDGEPIAACAPHGDRVSFLGTAPPRT
jgi:hypothetical protein